MGKKRRLHGNLGDEGSSPSSSAAGPEKAKKRHKVRPSIKQEARPSATAALPHYPYETDYCDHFETPLEAYRDLEPLLFFLARSIGKLKQDLTIYDPYYCKGAVVEHLSSLGFSRERIINRMRDFYQDVADEHVPDYDILVTNPPYSGDHKERCLEYCMRSGKPFCLLMPSYVANKSYYQQLLGDMSEASLGTGASAQKPRVGGDAQLKKACYPVYLTPTTKYEFAHPEGTGSATSPFYSIWYIHIPGLTTGSGLSWINRAQAKASEKGGGGWKLALSVEALRGTGAAPSWKRPSNKQRKRLKAKKIKAASNAQE